MQAPLDGPLDARFFVKGGDSDEQLHRNRRPSDHTMSHFTTVLDAIG
jgi:hypothetical protein